ncbi:uncharacterized protein [Dysidea avara]|uniref:uncharacterized protein n=1 Tax=Dysidea avara TaxID=196820 RepID=UPI00331C8245
MRVLKITTVVVSFLAQFAISLIVEPQESGCTQVKNLPPCVCSMDNKNIDLRSLAHKDTPAFSVTTKDGTIYYYNPCNSFTLGDHPGDCKDVAGCQDCGGSKRSIGQESTADFKTSDKDVVSIYYTNGTGHRSMVIQLQCNKTYKHKSKFESLGETNKDEYTLQLTSVCACPGGCNKHGPASSGGSSGDHHSKASKLGIPGLVVLSVFVIIVIVYFVAGMIINRVKFEKTGSDIIPNKELWFNLPFLVKDGVLFTFSPCVACYRQRRGYSNLN